MKTLLPTLFLATTLLACAPTGVEETVDTEGCEHLENGPATVVAAASSPDGAPAIQDDHRRYDITLTDVTGGRGGSVSFSVTQGGDYVLFLGQDVPVVVTGPAGATVAAEAHATSSPTCTAIKGRHVYPLTQVGTYTLTFGPTTIPSVSVVIERDVHAHAHGG